MDPHKKIRVLVYGDNGGSGGYVRYCKGLFGSGATPQDLEVIFVCSTPFYERLKPLDAGIKVIHHPWLASSARIYRYLWHVFVYPAIALRNSPDVEFYPSGQLRILFRRATSVTACHNLLLFDPVELDQIEEKQKRQGYELIRDRQAQAFQKAAGVIFSSDYSKKFISKTVPAIQSSCVVPLGVEKDFFVDRFAASNGPALKLLYVSPAFPYKHHQEVVQAIKILRDEMHHNVCLRLVGGGVPEALQKLKTMIAREEASEFVELVGFVSNNELIEEYRNTDVFVFASSCEAFGITLLEAMAAGLPIACSELVGLPDILKDAGEYFEPRDPRSIANALNKLILNKENREKFGEKARQYAAEFTWQRSAEMTYAFIRQVYEQKKLSSR